MDWENVKPVLDYGLPSMLLGAVCFAIYKLGRYILTQMVKPLFDSHIEFVKAAEEALKEQTSTMQAQSSWMQVMQEEIKALRTMMVSQGDAWRAWAEKMERDGK